MQKSTHVILVMMTFCTAIEAAGQEVRSIPLKSSVTSVQPMTGIVLWSDNEQAAKEAGAIALEYRYCGYNEVVGPKGEYDFSKIDRILDAIAGRNHQAVLRFYFCYVGKQTTVPDFILRRTDYDETVGESEGEKTHFCDWSNQALQNFTLDFYTRFAERYDKDPRIAFLQTGFGLWAEFHIYDGPRRIGKTFPTKQYQARFLRHLNDQFEQLPWSISIDSADEDYTPLEGNDELLTLDFGLFDDSFLCKPHPKENAVNWKILGPDRWKRSPAGGEFSYYNKKDQRNSLAVDGPNGVSFEDAAKQFHISYMIGNDQPRYQNMDRIASAGMATGYKFRVTSAAVHGKEIRLRVINEGVAPIYRDAYFTSGDQRSETSLRGLLPGESLDCSIANVSATDPESITIQCDAILPTQTIQFQADLD
ncbi:MAG: DUF4832 domain-containing protein [Planctomycetota bacterium]